MQLSQVIDRLPLVGGRLRRQEKFWDLAQHQTDFLYNVAYKYAGNHYDAEDLVQETLYKAFNNFHQLRDRGKLKSWLFSILRRHYLSGNRKHQPVRMVEMEDQALVPLLEAADGGHDIASIYERKVEAATVQSMLDRLPEKYKSVLILYYMEESTYQEIADMLEVPIGTVMSRLSRAKQLMKKSLLRSKPGILATNKSVRLNAER